MHNLLELWLCDYQKAQLRFSSPNTSRDIGNRTNYNFPYTFSSTCEGMLKYFFRDTITDNKISKQNEENMILRVFNFNILDNFRSLKKYPLHKTHQMSGIPVPNSVVVNLRAGPAGS